MVTIRSLFLLLSIVPSLLFAPIYQSHTIHDLLNHLDAAKAATTLLVFDLDNTLIETHELIGSDQWFMHMMSKHPHLHHSDAAQKVVPLYHAIRRTVPVKLVEASSATIIKNAQDCGFHTIGLTAQSDGLSDTTIKLLHELQINFSHTSPQYLLQLLPLPHRCLYKNGIVFCSGKNDKGKALITLLQETGFTPECVIFVDDKVKYLESVEKALSEHMPHTTFIGIRYAHLDEKVKNFDVQAAEKELAKFLEKNPDVRKHHVAACGG